MIFKIWFYLLIPGIIAMPVTFADTISGRAVDSVTHAPLNGVRVCRLSPACSTLSNQDGEFVLIVPGTGTFQPKILPVVAKASSESIIFSLNGRVVPKFSSAGSYIIASGTRARKVLSISESDRLNLPIFQPTVSKSGLVKKAASEESYIFSAVGYKTKTVKVKKDGDIGEIFLSPEEVVDDSVTVVEIDVKLKDSGTIKVGVEIKPDTSVVVP